MGVDYRLLRIELERQSDIVLREARPVMQQQFDLYKDNLMKDFDEHDVTQEINSGPKSDSKFIETVAGGNLFSFLGFKKNQNPADDLKKILDNNIQLKVSQTKLKTTQNAILIETPVEIPTIEELDDLVSNKTKLPWTNRAWTSLIEKGIPWFAHYLFDDRSKRNFKTSYSGTAIQVKGTITQDRSFSGKIKYMSELLGKFKKAISGK